MWMSRKDVETLVKKDREYNSALKDIDKWKHKLIVSMRSANSTREFHAGETRAYRKDIETKDKEIVVLQSQNATLFTAFQLAQGVTNAEMVDGQKDKETKE